MSEFEKEKLDSQEEKMEITKEKGMEQLQDLKSEIVQVKNEIKDSEQENIGNLKSEIDSLYSQILDTIENSEKKEKISQKEINSLNENYEELIEKLRESSREELGNLKSEINNKKQNKSKEISKLKAKDYNKIANIGRQKSSESVKETFSAMSQEGGIFGKIGDFFRKRV